jgi:hypothetical protein
MKKNNAKNKPTNTIETLAAPVDILTTEVETGLKVRVAAPPKTGGDSTLTFIEFIFDAPLTVRLSSGDDEDFAIGVQAYGDLERDALIKAFKFALSVLNGDIVNPVNLELAY